MSTDPQETRIGLVWATVGAPLYAFPGAGIAMVPSYFLPRGVVPQWLELLAMLAGATVGAVWWIRGVHDNWQHHGPPRTVAGLLKAKPAVIYALQAALYGLVALVLVYLLAV